MAVKFHEHVEFLHEMYGKLLNNMLKPTICVFVN